VIRPTDDKFAGGLATVVALTNDAMFTGQKTEFFQVLKTLAEEADAATRQS
jgi:hypothetical protein